MSIETAVDFSRAVEENLEVEELYYMVLDCTRITRAGNRFDEGYVKHAFSCSEHMALLRDLYLDGFKDLY